MPKRNAKGILIYEAGEDPNESLIDEGKNVFSRFRKQQFCSKIVMCLFMYFIQNFDTDIRPVHYSLYQARRWDKMLGFHVSIKGQKILEHHGRISFPPLSFFVVMDNEDGFLPILTLTMDSSVATSIKFADLDDYNLSSDARNPQFLYNYWIMLEAIIRIVRIMGLPFWTHPNEVIRKYFERKPYEDTVFYLWASCIWSIALKLKLYPAVFLKATFNDDMTMWFTHHLCLSANILCFKPTEPGQVAIVPKVKVNPFS
jgi:hypothetical protein